MHLSTYPEGHELNGAMKALCLNELTQKRLRDAKALPHPGRAAAGPADGSIELWSNLPADIPVMPTELDLLKYYFSDLIEAAITANA